MGGTMTNLYPMKASEDARLSSVAVISFYQVQMCKTPSSMHLSPAWSFLPTVSLLSLGKSLSHQPYWELFVIQLHSATALKAKILLLLVILWRLMQSPFWNNREQLKPSLLPCDILCCVEQEIPRQPCDKERISPFRTRKANILADLLLPNHSPEELALKLQKALQDLESHS